MIEKYFDLIEKIIRDFPYISSYALNKKYYSTTQGFIKGEIIFEDGSILEFIEVKNIEKKEKIKYRYHFMDKKNI